MRDLRYNLRNIEHIYEDPDMYKHGQAGLTRKELFNLIPSQERNNDTFYIVEGYATGNTVFRATNSSVVCSFSCNNMPSIIRLVRMTWSNAKIFVARDIFKMPGPNNPNDPNRNNVKAIEKIEKAFR